MLLKSKNFTHPSKNDTWEEIGVLLELTNPRARLSRTETRGKVFTSLGELLWYLSETNDLEFIRYYIPFYDELSDDGKTIYGGYGPRLFNMRGEINQVANVIDLLKNKQDSRQTVIQLFDAVDITEARKDIPCTCTLQFMFRRPHLHMVTYMRSNDAFLGLPHDIFAFTMLQEIFATTLGAELGTYKHAVGSLHLYDKDREKAQQYLDEGFQSTMTPMPPMPAVDPWPSITRLLEAEDTIRNGCEILMSDLDLDPYWADLVRLLQIFANSKKGDTKAIEKISPQMHSDIYKPYIEQRKAIKNVKSTHK